MIGPYPRGKWTNHCSLKAWRLLIPGYRYRVTQTFTDHDRHLHAPGETWTCLGCNFLPYDDGLSIFVSLDGEQEWHIRMQLDAEQQGEIVDHLDQYLAAVPPMETPPMESSS